MNGTMAYSLAMKKVKGLASGFDHAVRTGDTTFSIFFIDGSSVNLTIPLPADGVDGADGADGEDGVSITGVTIDDDGHLIVSLSDGTTTDAGEIPESTSGGVLSEDLTATVAIGTVTSGKKYTKGTSIESIIRDILIKEEAPGVVLTLNPATSLYDAVTETVSNIVLIAQVTKKTYAPKTVKYYVDGTLANTRNVTDGGNFSYSHVFSPATNVDHTFKVVVSDGKLENTASKTIKFVAKSYYGVVADDIGTPTEAQIKGLANNTLKDVKGLTFSGITTDFGKVCYAYPSSMGALASIKDPVNNYNYTDSFSKTTVSVDGISYFVYTQTEPSAADNVKLVFA